MAVALRLTAVIPDIRPVASAVDLPAVALAARLAVVAVPVLADRRARLRADSRVLALAPPRARVRRAEAERVDRPPALVHRVASPPVVLPALQVVVRDVPAGLPQDLAPRAVRRVQRLVAQPVAAERLQVAELLALAQAVATTGR